MRKTITTVAALVGVLLLASAPATADLYVGFDLDNAALSYQAAGNTMSIVGKSGSTLTVERLDDGDPPWTWRDSATVAGSAAFSLDLTFTDLPGTDNWSAAGTLTLTDNNANVTQASFTSISVEINEIGSDAHLDMEGYLSPVSGNDWILLDQGGNAWVFEGTGDLGGNNDDGVSNQITMNPGSDGGTLWTFDFDVVYMSEDTFFGSDRASGDSATGWGNVEGSIVPVPAAVVLGVIGLGLVGWRMRKYA